MCEDVVLLLIGVDHDEDIHEILLSVVLRVAYDITCQFPGKIAHTGLFLLYFGTDLDLRIIDDLIFVPEESEQTANVVRSEVGEIGEGVSGED